MMGNRPDLTVLVRSTPSTGGWRAQFRPCGPAGELTVRLPLGLTVSLDAAQPELVLEVSARQVHASTTAFLAILFGDRAAALVRREESGEVPYAPADSDQGQLLTLLVALGTADERPAITAIDLADHARRLAAERTPGGGESDLAFLLGRIATEQAFRAVAMLRALPPRSALGLTLEQEAGLDRALAVVTDLAGDHLPLGPVSVPEPTWRESEGAGQDWEPSLGLRPLAEGVSALRRAQPGSGAGALIDIRNCPLPLVVHDLRLTEPEPGTYHLDAGLTFAEFDEDETPVELPPPVSSVAAPQVWARAIRLHDGVVLYVSQCLIQGSRLSASLVIKPEYRYPNQFWIELTSVADAPVQTPELRQFEQASRQGARAAALQRSASEPEQWAAVGRLWRDCAKLWSWAQDAERQALAATHAARAFRTAGPTFAAEAASVAGQARALPPLDPRWLAPDLAQQAARDPLRVNVMIHLAGLGAQITAWAVAELEGAVRAAVPVLSEQELKQLLSLLPAEPHPAAARLRRLRAQLRVALAYRASEQPETLPLASLLMAPVSADWPYLDGLGRQRFSVVNLRLLQLDDDLAEQDDAP